MCIRDSYSSAPVHRPPAAWHSGSLARPGSVHSPADTAGPVKTPRSPVADPTDPRLLLAFQSLASARVYPSAGYADPVKTRRFPVADATGKLVV